MKKLLIFLIVSLLLVLPGCNKPNDPEHLHEYVDGICSCGELEKNKLFIEYDKEVAYTQYGKLKVTSTYENDEVKIVSRNFGIVKIDKNQADDMILYGVCPGTATIVVSNKYGENIELSVNVVFTPEYSPIIGFNVRLEETGPYYMGETYHVHVQTFPDKYVGDEYGFIKNELYDFNKDTMEIVFNHTGTFEFKVYSSVLNLTESYEVEIVPNPNREEYHVLFVGNSLTYVHDIPAIIKNMVEADGGYFGYIQQTVGGAYIKDHENNFNRNMDLYTYTDVILQGQSFEAIGNYSEFEEYMLKYSARVKETSAKLHFYQTWGYDKEKWAASINGVTTIITQFEMYDGLQSAYDLAASKAGASVTRSGEAFEIYLKEYDLPSLYQDMNHQSIYGAYLSACCHYAMLTGKSPVNNSYVIDGIEPEVIEIIKEIADRVCFNK